MAYFCWWSVDIEEHNICLLENMHNFRLYFDKTSEKKKSMRLDPAPQIGHYKNTEQIKPVIFSWSVEYYKS